jgi:membrane fusion protein (multidrug efflux system)
MDSTPPSSAGDRQPEIPTHGDASGIPATQSGAERRAHEAPQGPMRRRTMLKIAAAALIILVGIVAGVLIWRYESHFVGTDDAFIDTRIAAVSPRVSGQVISVPVVDNEKVAAGQILVQIDPTPFRVALRQSLAAEQLARTGLGQARANVSVARAAVEQARAAYISTQAQTANALANLHRYLFLRRRNIKALARTQLDQVEAAARSAKAQLRVAQEKIAGAQAELEAAQAAVAGAMARVANARAHVAAARLDLSYTTVRAAEAGHVTKKSVAIGNYVSPGQELMALVPLKMWVTANIKETDLYLIHPGQRVSIHIDACPNATVHGKVQSIQRGSGVAFDLLPPQNATGNYVKVVQRVPVRITFDAPPSGCVLGPGMSVEPEIRIN